MKRTLQKIKSYWLSETSSISLLVLLIFMVFFMPILIEYEIVSIVVLNLLFLSLYFTGIFSSRKRWVIYLAAVLFCINVVLQLIRFGDSPYEYYLVERVLGLLNMALFIFINLSLLFHNAESNSYKIIGAINVYLLFAVMGAFAFEILEMSTGQSISGHVKLANDDTDYAIFVYYSLVTLTTLGYGEVYPEAMPARMISVVLSTIGMLYPVIVIARLVADNRPGRTNRNLKG